MRCWFVDGGLVLVVWRDLPWIGRPEAIGMLLVDLARHAGRMFADQKLSVEASGLAAIRAAFDGAWGAVTGERLAANTVVWSAEAKPPRIAELSVPAVAVPGGGGEVMRVWRTRTGIEVAMIPIWEAPGNWGILLVDLARGLASAFEGRDGGHPFPASLQRIRWGFDAEWNRPTDIGTTVASRVL